MEQPPNSNADPAQTHQLVLRMQRGDERALAEIAKQFATQLGSIATVITGRIDLAQEIVQDALFAFWIHRDQLDADSNPMGYLYRAVHNRSIDLLRKEQAQGKATETAAIEVQLNNAGIRNDAEEILASADVSTQLRQALSHVASGPRRVFLLHYESGLDYPEIAAMLGVTVATVRTMMYRATRRLAEVISKERLLGL